jgi:phosphopantothenoylcysteine decarboxylase/phosphopantothenate--cysteine ligase
MARAVEEKKGGCTVIIGAAAVSDYTPESVADQKIKKGAAGITLALKPTIDIMATLGKQKSSGQILVGFSVETRDLIKNSSQKLKRKNLDLIVCNDVTQQGAGFATDTNIVTILDAKGEAQELPKMSKLEAAHKILDRVRALL